MQSSWRQLRCPGGLSHLPPPPWGSLTPTDLLGGQNAGPEWASHFLLSYFVWSLEPFGVCMRAWVHKCMHMHMWATCVCMIACTHVHTCVCMAACVYTCVCTRELCGAALISTKGHGGHVSTWSHGIYARTQSLCPAPKGRGSRPEHHRAQGCRLLCGGPNPSALFPAPEAAPGR